MSEQSDTKEVLSSQPQVTAPMKAGGNKNALNREIGADGKREWSFGLFDCFNACGLYCSATWCPCVFYSRSKRRLRSLQDNGTPFQGGDERYIDDCIGGCFVSPNAMLKNRADIRNRYGIRGSTVGDFLIYSGCGPCAFTQERRELELEERSLES